MTKIVQFPEKESAKEELIRVLSNQNIKCFVLLYETDEVKNGFAINVREPADAVMMAESFKIAYITGDYSEVPANER